MATTENILCYILLICVHSNASHYSGISKTLLVQSSEQPVHNVPHHMSFAEMSIL